jgi:hypothetical protein
MTTVLGQRSQRGRALGGAAFAVLLALAGCAAAPLNAPQELLDEATGTTLTRLITPIELTSLEPRGANADPFAYVAPFETNRMGERRLYLWLAIPDEQKRAVVPVVQIDGARLEAGAPLADVGAAGLARWPYAAPAPWSAVHVFQIDAIQLAALARAGELHLSDAGGGLAFAARLPAPSAIAEFSKRVGLQSASP